MSNSLKENIKLALTMILIGILLLYIVFQMFIPDMTVKVFGFKPYTVLTRSMEPVINKDDMIFVRQFDLDEAEIGDIISFDADINYDGTMEVVTHYIYSITDNGDDTIIRTNRYYDDDTEVVPDTWLLTQEDVHGSYWFKLPQVGLVTDFLRSPFGIGTIIVNIGIITAIVYLVKGGKKQ
jgi:signal peptidase